MSFKVPSLADVSRTIENGFSSAFYGTSGTLRVGVLKVLSRVVAGGCYLPILFCQYIFRNSFIDTCDVENLVRFGGWYNIPHKVASPARGLVYIAFSKAATIPAGTILVDQNTNDEYQILESVTNDSNSSVTKYGKVVAVDVGQQGNRSSYETTTLSFRDGEIDGVSDIHTQTLKGGASFDVSVNGIVEQWGEDVESYRARLKFRRQHPPMGGADSDYKMWAERFTQVTDAFVFANFPNTNSVSIFLADYNSNISLNETGLKEVREYLNSSNRKPITADVRVASVDPVNVSLTIKMPNIGGNTKKNVVDTLRKEFKGFGLGDTITTSLVNKILIDNGVAPSCETTEIKVNGSDRTTGYKFKLNIVDEEIHGEVVNIDRIEEYLTLVVQ